MKVSKRVKSFRESIDFKKEHSLEEAIKILKEKFKINLIKVFLNNIQNILTQSTIN